MGIRDFFQNLVGRETNPDEPIANLNMDSLGSFLKKNKSITKSRSKMQSILKDLMPHNKLKSNLLMMGYDEAVLSLVGKNLTVDLLTKFQSRIEAHHGVGSENARWIMVTWLHVIF